MKAGNALIGLALLLSLSSFACYFAVSAGRLRFIGAARKFFTGSSLCVLASSAILWAMFLGNRFDVNYIQQFSSFRQPLVYKISAFWGGQEGSWLIWLTWISLIGLALYRKAGSAEGPAMTFWSSVQVFFLVILALKSPFQPASRQVADGFGLNPLLQNYWMAIHPPALFMGFTLISVPAAFAVAALVQRDFATWTRRAFGWAVLGWTALGAGTLLGGVWAYETLGWGGWWGWDPVENASLVPWLLGGALVHGLMLDRKKGSWSKMNLYLALACFLLVIYATFLTRSGILGDFSVHSFAALGNSNWLLGFLTAYTVILTGLVAFRAGSRKAGPADLISVKELLVFSGIVLFGLSAALVALGMSSPLLSRLFTGKAGNVPTVFYYRVCTPILIGVLILVGFSPLVSWARERSKSGRSSRAWIIALAAGFLVGLAYSVYTLNKSGLEAGARWAVGACSAAALVPNFWTLIDTLRRRGWALSGGHIAHVGLSIFFMGMLAGTMNNKQRPDRLELKQAETKQYLGSKWTFVGLTEAQADGKQAFRITIDDGGSTFAATPTLQTVRDGSQMRRPYIKKGLGGDLYIAPVSIEADGVPPHAEIAKGKKGTVGPWTVTFNRFTGMQELPDGRMKAGALITVTGPDGEEHNLQPGLTAGAGGMQYLPAKIPGTKDSIMIGGMSVDSGLISVVLDGPAWRREVGLTAVVEVTYKPFVWALWFGAFLMILGGGVSTARRVREARMLEKMSLADIGLDESKTYEPESAAAK